MKVQGYEVPEGILATIEAWMKDCGPCEAEHEEPSVSVDDVDAADAYDEDRQEGERVR